MNRINLICLGVRDMKRSLEFYKNIGFQTYVNEKNPPIVFFDTQGSKLELYPLDELAKDINEKDPPNLSSGGFGGITLACCLKSKKAVDELFDLVIKHKTEDILKLQSNPKKYFGADIAGIFRIRTDIIGKSHMVRIGNLTKMICLIIDEE